MPQQHTVESWRIHTVDGRQGVGYTRWKVHIYTMEATQGERHTVEGTQGKGYIRWRVRKVEGTYGREYVR